MNEYAGVNVRLSRNEFERLTEQARQELRHPRDHARWLLREALGLTSSEEIQRGTVSTNNKNANTSQGGGVLVTN